MASLTLSKFCKSFCVLVLLLWYQILETTQAHFGLNSYCIHNGTNDISFGTKGDASYGTFGMSSSKNSSYQLGVNCTVQLRAPTGYKLHLSFSEISTRSCDLDKIEINLSNSVNDVTDNAIQLCGHRSCPAENCNDLQFDAPVITIHFTTATNKTNNTIGLTGFMSMVTVYSNADSHGNCYSKDQFRCRNRHCIWNGLFCNKHNHCGDESDEPQGCKPFAQQTVWGVLGIILGIVSFCIFLPVFCFMAIRGQRQQVKVIRSTYQPIPTSINIGENHAYNAAILRDENAPSYKFYDSSASTSESTPVHSKYVPYQNV